VLDTVVIAFRIYIWYEDGELIAIPSEARQSSFELALPKARKVPRSEERRHSVSVPGGSHERWA